MVTSTTAVRIRQLPAWADAAAARPLRGIGGYFAMALDTFVAMFKLPFPWRELWVQTWFVARATLLPTLMLSIPYVVLTVFTFNVLLVEFGAADYSGSGAALAAVNQIGPFVTVLAIAGAAAAAMCADLGARTIREELDALRVMGIDPIRALVVPRVLAATVVSLLLSSLVTLTGLTGGFVFSVYLQHVSPGAFVSHMTFITGLGDVVVSMVKATLFASPRGCSPAIRAFRSPGDRLASAWRSTKPSCSRSWCCSSSPTSSPPSDSR